MINLKNILSNLWYGRDWPWFSFCRILKLKLQTANWAVIAFEYVPDCYFVLEFDFNLSGTGSFSRVTDPISKIDSYHCERSVIHIVLFRTKFGLRKKWTEKYHPSLY